MATDKCCVCNAPEIKGVLDLGHWRYPVCQACWDLVRQFLDHLREATNRRMHWYERARAAEKDSDD